MHPDPRSPLALGAPHGGPLTDDPRLELVRADHAAQSCPPVHAVPVLEAPPLPIRILVIPKGAAPRRDRLSENSADLPRQQPYLGPAERHAPSARQDLGPE